MKTITTLAAGLAILAVAGCVPTEKYEALRIRAEGLEAQADKAQNEANAANARSQALENQLGDTAGGQQGLQGLLAEERQRNERLQNEVNQLRGAYDSALAGGGTQLPAPVVTDLNRFASQNPGLVTFDPERGIVRFTSDLTFGSGSAVLQQGASNAIGRFAEILNSDAARGYELMIAGHTDNVPVANPVTAKAHPDNWYLSSHRAISVAAAMRRAGIDKNRLAVVGYADQRPVASNDTADGRTSNRRVEVLILPTRAPDAVPAGEPNTPSGQMPDDNEPAGMGMGTPADSK